MASVVFLFSFRNLRAASALVTKYPPCLAASLVFIVVPEGSPLSYASISIVEGTITLGNMDSIKRIIAINVEATICAWFKAAFLTVPANFFPSTAYKIPVNDDCQKTFVSDHETVFFLPN